MLNVELVNTGSELMLGRVLNTHQQWLCRRLADAGMPVTRQVAIADTGEAIRRAAAEALERAALVVVTGGLGPTSDDITRELIAGMLGTRLVEHAASRENIERFFAARGRKMPARVLVQAMVPEGARVLPNAQGTAPGLAIEVPAGRFAAHRSLLVMLPGPPRELRPMFDVEAMPVIREVLPPVEAFHCVTVRTLGVGESWVEETLSPELPALEARGLEVGYCARNGEVDVRLVGRGSAGAALVQDAESMVRRLLGASIYGAGDDTLEAMVVQRAVARGATLACAESCTGGFIAHRLTNVPGASEVFQAGWVTYSNQAKIRELGVPESLLAEHGAVSVACARAMAERARVRADVSHALAVTGIAGPGGGTPEKPVGTVHLALAVRGGETTVVTKVNAYDRETFKWVTAQQGLDLLRRALL
ncbi:MAG: competence/damage-inducible protein A [Verrucomicrobiales bacterium]|nr:competence/damage-inducible protein A [Verrucomicrobiales bacterium]